MHLQGKRPRPPRPHYLRRTRAWLSTAWATPERGRAYSPADVAPTGMCADAAQARPPHPIRGDTRMNSAPEFDVERRSRHAIGRRNGAPRALSCSSILTLVWGSTWPLFSIAVHEVSVWTFRAISVSVAGLVVLGAARVRGQSLAHPAQALAAHQLSRPSSTSCCGTSRAPMRRSCCLRARRRWSASRCRCGQRSFRGRCSASASVRGSCSASRSARLPWLLLMVPSFQAYAQAPAGLAMGLVAAIGWAIGTLILKRGKVDVPATVLTGWQLLIAAVPTAIGARDPRRRRLVHAVLAVDRGDRLHRARADGDRQRRMVRDRRHPAGQRGGPFGRRGAGSGDARRRAGAWRAARRDAVAAMVCCVVRALARAVYGRPRDDGR